MFSISSINTYLQRTSANKSIFTFKMESPAADLVSTSISGATLLGHKLCLWVVGYWSGTGAQIPRQGYPREPLPVCLCTSSINTLPYMAEGTLLMWLNERPWDEKIPLDYLSGPNIITRVFRRGRQEGQRSGNVTMDSEMAVNWPQAKECQQTIYAWSGKERILLGPL